MLPFETIYFGLLVLAVGFGVSYKALWRCFLPEKLLTDEDVLVIGARSNTWGFVLMALGAVIALGSSIVILVQQSAN